MRRGRSSGETSGSAYTVSDAARRRDDDDTVTMQRLHDAGRGGRAKTLSVEPGDGFAKNDGDGHRVPSGARRLIRVDQNDDDRARTSGMVSDCDQRRAHCAPDSRCAVENDGRSHAFGPRARSNFTPYKGMANGADLAPLARNRSGAHRGNCEHRVSELHALGAPLGWSLYPGRSWASVFGALVGIPLGYAMGLSNWFRGWFDPIVEFMRPVPPLALIPLVIIWAGIGETGKIILLFLAALVDHDHCGAGPVSRASNDLEGPCGLFAGGHEVPASALCDYAEQRCRRSSPARGSRWGFAGAPSSPPSSSPPRRGRA